MADRYEIVELIGEGGMGVVFKVTDRQDGQERALKILKATAENRSASERRFRREYRALARLHHPAVVDVFDTGIFDPPVPFFGATPGGHLFFAMEYVRGHTLREWGALIPDAGRNETQIRQDLDFYLQTMVTVLDALSDVHQSGIVHRDLKPQNIMIDHEGSVRIMDFGVALEMAAEGSDTSSNMILGTVGYVSPEEVRGVKLDARADLFAVGAMLYEYVTGELPFDDENPVVAFSRMLKEAAVPPRKLNAVISAQLEEAIMKLLERDPEQRFQTAEEAAFALNLCLESGAHTFGGELPTTSMRMPKLFPSRFVGQQVSLDVLTRMLDKASRGQGKMALVVGEAGIGKTRLVQELAAGTDRSQLLVLSGGCFEREGVYYQPYVEMIGEYVRRIGRTSKRDQLMERLYDADLFPLMRELSRSDDGIAPAPGPHGPAGSEERVRLFEAVTRLIADFAARRPILRHLDDMHFADELTLDLTRYVARNLKGSPVLIVVALRPEEVKRPEAASVRRFLDETRREGLMDAEVKLGRLPKEDVRDLFISLARWEPGSDLLDGVYRLTDGIPYFVEEVVKTIAEPGRSRPAGELPIPETVAEIVARQLRAFTGGETEVLRIAAHIGTDFEFDLLLEVTGRREADLLDVIDHLLRQGILTEIATSRTDAYRFTHPIMREVLMRQVSDRRRRKTHVAIARAMEELYHDRLESELGAHIEEIARHFRLGGDAEKAFEYGWIAAKKAMERRAYDAAARHHGALYELYQAGEISPPQGLRVEMFLDLGTAWEKTGRMQEARDLYESELTRLIKERNLAARSEVAHRLARIFAQQGKLDEALEQLEGCLYHGATLDPGMRIRLETERARLLESKGEHQEALAVLFDTLGKAEASGAALPLAEAMGLLGGMFTARGEHLEASRTLEKALEIVRAAEPSDGRPLVATLLTSLAENAHQAMDPALEIRFYEEALRELERSWDLLGAVTPLAREGRAYVTLGEMDRGREILKDALKRCRRYALTGSLPLALEAMSLYSMYKGKLRSSRAELLEAYDLAESVGEAPALFQVSLSLGKVLGLLGAFNEARGYLGRAHELALEKGNTFWRVQALTATAECALDAERLAEARDALSQIEGLEQSLRALLAPRQFIPSYIVGAMIAFRDGNLDAARERFARAFKSLSGVVWPHALGLCHLRHAQFLRGTGDRSAAKDELERSRRVWSWLGTSHYLRACDDEARLLAVA
ncbi:MAG: protein kinase [Acidobacteriota bacterium]